MISAFIKNHRTFIAALAAGGLLALLPVANAVFLIGQEWRGVPQSYGDEVLYYNHIQEIGSGNLRDGNPYLIEHRFDAPLVLFGGNWIAAIPLILGVPFIPALVLNFIIWSMIFVGLAYWLLREFALPRLLAASGSLLSYMSVYGLVFRPSSRQEVFPFFLLFFIALIRFLKRPEQKSSVIFLGLSTAATFYVFSYLWQTAVITLGLLALYALLVRSWPLLRSTLLASALGGALGAPSLLYMFYLSGHPYFWESLSRFGLVETRLPMAEVIYSGGWVGLILVLLAFIYWRVPALRLRPQFFMLSLFVALTGLGLWIMQGSNIVTGKLLETGEHIRPFIGPWLVLVGVPLVWYFAKEKMIFPILAVVVALFIPTYIFISTYFYPYVYPAHQALWIEQQTYAGALQWLEHNVSEPSVVWVHPHHGISYFVPTLTKHYVLYAQPAMFNFISDEEVAERYLVSRYFDVPTIDALKQDISLYRGRGDAYHRAKTIERGVKICRILNFWRNYDCGVAPTSTELLGEEFFANLERKFANDIRPNIDSYLEKYHVAYSIRDTVYEPQADMESLSALKVYDDGRYEIYRFP